MRARYVWLVCGLAIAVIESLSAFALRGGFVRLEALESLSYTLYLVAGVGAGRLEASGRVGRAIRAGGIAGGVTGLIGSIVGQGVGTALGVEPTASLPALGLLLSAMITVLTGGSLGLLGGIAGWGVRRAVEPIV